jgi:aryl sulfotransferase
MAGILWLASYPKSGNTWMRIFLTNYLQNGEQPVDINRLDGGPIASAREIFDELVGVEASDLTLPEQEILRPKVYQQFARELTQNEFLKVHDAYTLNSAGLPLFPPEASRGIIYILRNPLSVAPSLANHLNKSIDDAITVLNNEKHQQTKRLAGLGSQLPQRWLSWGEHVRSWAEASDQRIHLVRYEDMKKHSFDVFRSVILFAGLDDDEARIRKAIEFSSFEKVKQQETEKGFRERVRLTSFFRKGETGAWKSELNPEQIERILAVQAKTMRQYGYIDEAGQPAEAISLEEFSYV